MFAAASSGGVWKTTDGGASWKPLTGLLANLAVNALAVDRSTPNILYAGTGEGFYNTGSIRGAGIFKSTDGGANWARLEGTAGQDFYYVNKIIISPNNSQRLYAATRTGLWRSLDGGANWTDIDGAGAGALPDVPALCIVVDPNNRQRLFIGRDVGVFVSTGGGTSWVVERGLPNVSTETLAINTTTTSTQLFAFMFGGGAWRVDLGSAYCKAAISPASLPLDSNGGNRSVAISFGSGGASCTWSANVNASGGVASMTRDIAGNVYFVDSFNSRIRKLFVDTGVITTVAGGGQQGFADNVPATQTQISTPATITLDSTGNLYVVSSVVESRRHRA